MLKGGGSFCWNYYKSSQKKLRLELFHLSIHIKKSPFHHLISMTFQNDQTNVKTWQKMIFQLKKGHFLCRIIEMIMNLCSSHMSLSYAAHHVSYLSACFTHKSIIIHLPYFFLLALAHIRLLIYLIVARMFSLLVILISFPPSSSSVSLRSGFFINFFSLSVFFFGNLRAFFQVIMHIHTHTQTSSGVEPANLPPLLVGNFVNKLFFSAAPKITWLTTWAN